MNQSCFNQTNQTQMVRQQLTINQNNFPWLTSNITLNIYYIPGTNYCWLSSNLFTIIPNQVPRLNEQILSASRWNSVVRNLPQQLIRMNALSDNNSSGSNWGVGTVPVMITLTAGGVLQLRNTIAATGTVNLNCQIPMTLIPLTGVIQ